MFLPPYFQLVGLKLLEILSDIICECQFDLLVILPVIHHDVKIP